MPSPADNQLDTDPTLPGGNWGAGIHADPGAATELRRNPSLRGTVTPELVIEESGAVSSCKAVESSLDKPTLESKICSRLQLVNFGEKDGAGSFRFRYPIELLPG